MPTTIDGATITLLVELGDATMVLGRDVLGDVMSGQLEGAADLTCDTITATWSWGARTFRRFLTETETGQLTATIDDPERRFDPTNDAGPHYEALRRDRPVRVLVGADVTSMAGTRYTELPAWTGKVRQWTYDWGTARTTLVAYDALEEAGRASISTTAPAGTPGHQATAAATAAGMAVNVEERYTNVQRSTHRFGTNLREALLDCRLAALGHVWCDRSGRLQWADRSHVGKAIVFSGPFLIGCEPGPAVGSLQATLDRSELINAVRVDRHDPQGTGLSPFAYRNEPSIAAYGLHPLITSEEELDLEPAAAQAYSEWAAVVLNDSSGMGQPADELEVGGVRAEGLGVLQLACSDYMAPLWLRFPGYFGRRLNLYGLRATITPDGWSFELVTGATFGYPGNTEAH
jgi:hypothetical protein